MSDSNSNQPDMIQPHRPLMRGALKYDVLREAEATIRKPNNAAKLSNKTELFTMTITAISNKGGSMDNEENDEQFLLNVLFKPTEKRLRLSPELSQLLLAHIGEILKEIAEEERCIVEGKQ